MRRTGFALAALAVALGLCTFAASAGAPTGEDADAGDSAAGTARSTQLPRLHVVASTDIAGDVVSAVGGEWINLHVLVGHGHDPHSHEPAPRSVTEVSDADLVFVNGLGLEEGLLDVIADVAQGPVIVLSEGVETEDDDPHTWMSPLNVKVWVENILRALAGADPARSALFQSNAAAYQRRLDELDQQIRQLVAGVPAERRLLVTDHHVFGYFAREYGFQEIGAVLPAASTSAEASPAALSALVRQMRQHDVTTVFVGEEVSGRVKQLAELVAEEAGEQVRIVSVRTGSLAPPGQPGDTYLDFMLQNVATIVDALKAE
jgi:ABC-type Zn uptake system ZnuABC Zn-binding protein ZnuA